LIKAGLPYLFDCKPQLIKFLFRHFVRLIVKGGLSFFIFWPYPKIHIRGSQPGVNFTYPVDKFYDTVVHFSTALVSKQKTGGKFYVRKLARSKREKKGWEPLI